MESYYAGVHASTVLLACPLVSQPTVRWEWTFVPLEVPAHSAYLSLLTREKLVNDTNVWLTF